MLQNEKIKKINSKKYFIRMHPSFVQLFNSFFGIGILILISLNKIIFDELIDLKRNVNKREKAIKAKKGDIKLLIQIKIKSEINFSFIVCRLYIVKFYHTSKDTDRPAMHFRQQQNIKQQQQKVQIKIKRKNRM